MQFVFHLFLTLLQRRTMYYFWALIIYFSSLVNAGFLVIFTQAKALYVALNVGITVAPWRYRTRWEIHNENTPRPKGCFACLHTNQHPRLSRWTSKISRLLVYHLVFLTILKFLYNAGSAAAPRTNPLLTVYPGMQHSFVRSALYKTFSGSGYSFWRTIVFTTRDWRAKGQSNFFLAIQTNVFREFYRWKKISPQDTWKASSDGAQHFFFKFDTGFSAFSFHPSLVSHAVFFLHAKCKSTPFFDLALLSPSVPSVPCVVQYTLSAFRALFPQLSPMSRRSECRPQFFFYQEAHERG